MLPNSSAIRLKFLDNTINSGGYFILRRVVKSPRDNLAVASIIV